MKSNLTCAAIAESLRLIGLQPGDAVGVHSSLSSLGQVEGGPDTVIDALLDVIGAEGTLIFPTYSNNRELLDLTPEERALGLAMKIRALPYDAAAAGCWTGAIPKAFLRRPGRVRGCDPLHSLAAIGRHQEHFATKRWEALWALDGVILLIGVGLGSCSAMHLVERLFVTLPDRILARLKLPPELVDRYRDLTLVFEPYPEFSKMEAPCRAAGIMREGRVGAASVKLIRLRALLDAYARALQEDPDSFYGT
ncbi:MAG: AAC(3) family N-acetyltransferase [Candidatus Hydrogenedentes bacterium]|nr:AAC(3) family N-acetyltransferase [Candidatus Hydrogenedentota bacterium]